MIVSKENINPLGRYGSPFCPGCGGGKHLAYHRLLLGFVSRRLHVAGSGKSVVSSGYFGFFHHIGSQNANIRAFKIASISYVCNRSKVNSV